MTALPQVAVLLREVREAFELRNEVDLTCRVCDRTVRRYFEGQHVERSCCVQSALLGSLIITFGQPLQRWLPKYWEFLSGSMLSVHLTAWNTHVAGRGTAGDARALVRFVAANFANTAAWMVVALDARPLDEVLPVWSSTTGPDRMLEALIAECTWQAPSKELAEALGVHVNTISNWRRGKRDPDRRHQELLADEFAARIDGANSADLRTTLHLHFGLKRLARSLANTIGREHFEDAVLRAIRFANHRADDLRPRLEPGLPLERLIAVLKVAWVIPHADIWDGCCCSHHPGNEWIADVRRGQELFLGGRAPSVETATAAIEEHFTTLRPHAATSRG
jgi:transcriptional regulator with XRE-family HTH domain